MRIADGSEVWSGRYPAEYEMHSATTRHGKGPKATPAVAERRLFTLGINGILPVPIEARRQALEEQGRVGS